MEHVMPSCPDKRKAKVVAREKRNHEGETASKEVRRFPIWEFVAWKKCTGLERKLRHGSVSMSKNRKRNRRKEFAWRHRGRKDYLKRRLGTSDGVDALNELVWSTTAAMVLLLITVSVLFNKGSLAGTMRCVTSVLVLDRALVRLESAKPMKRGRLR